MQDIKFRGMSIATGEWVYGGYFWEERCGYNHDATCHFIVNNNMENVEVDPATVGQFTGFRRNADVYKDDICDTRTRFGKGVVTFEDGMFKLCGLSLVTFSGKLEVIGNIFDNPELLTKEA